MSVVRKQFGTSTIQAMPRTASKQSLASDESDNILDCESASKALPMSLLAPGDKGKRRMPNQPGFSDPPEV